MAEYLDVDLRTLHLPPSRLAGADPIKLTRQFSKHGLSTAGMPALIVCRDGNGRLQILDGATRATRVAKWLPGQNVRVEVIDEDFDADFSSLPMIGDRLP